MDMKSHPYLGVRDTVRKATSELLVDDYHTVHRARLARTLDLLCTEIEKISRTDGIRILELGTSGFIPQALSQLFPGVTIDVTNFDDKGEVVQRLGKPVSGRAAYGSVEVDAFTIDLEYEDIPAADGTYDIVLCCEVLEHMEIDPMFMLGEVNRVLKNNGVLLLTTPNVLSSRGLTKMSEGHEPYFYMQYHSNRAYHRHNYEYTVNSVWRLLRAGGFDATVWTEDLFEDGLTFVVQQLKKLGWKVDHVGDNILVTATKISGVVERHPFGLYV